MSHLREKSKFNLASAQLLIDNDYFAPSVHCSYYGCFQFIKYKLDNIGHTFKMMDEEITASNNTLSSHNYPITLILNKVKEKSDEFYKRGIKDKIKSLKTLRELSDYHDLYIDNNKSREALRISNEVIDLINKKL